MRIIFMGTPDFAVASLNALLEAGFEIVGVITAPDKPAGRGKKMRGSAVKDYALSKELHLMQPTNLKAPEFVEELRALKADLQVVVAFRMLPEVVWNMPPKGTINLHGSLLPQYRGAAPINRAVMNGETITGVSTFFLQQQIDTGNILFRKEIPIGPNDTAGKIHDELMEVGAKLIVETVQAIEKGVYTEIPQADIDKATLHEAPKIFREDCRIDWAQEATHVWNHIRGLLPYPAPWTELISPEGEVFGVKIHNAALLQETGGEPGSISINEEKEIVVAAKNGCIAIKNIQMAGKKSVDTRGFLNGFPLDEKWRFQ